MTRKILYILTLLVLFSYNTLVESKNKHRTEVIETEIKVDNIFTCYNMNMLTMTNGVDIYCREDRVSRKKIKYDKDVVINQINYCINTNSIAILNLEGEVTCVGNDDKKDTKQIKEKLEPDL